MRVLAEIITLMIMAFAVSMDAFSISLGIGAYKIRLRQIFYIGIVVGGFHLLMPLLGIFAGQLLSGTFGTITIYIGGTLLIIVGLQMVFTNFLSADSLTLLPVGWGVLFFSFLVSIDSFSAGLSLGIFGAKAALAVICFSVVSIGMTWGGLLIGRKVQNMLGMYGEILGGVILIAFGIKLLIPFPW
ncbi:manganese efflux pump MntP family protein [Lederbergia sp. NSJ-179]|uniref:manganese efflux pump MntP n=1 Tax=Lederbergia sp. NSJ-179 TaxID=2931402 RepID=UPI001FD41CD3|nr:manganese efflux pump MntP family protein [Lederbergia sp. NSJ-179]MCJ7840563.1 manganese efflux pump MntP family protein [Lederbergia sp. NSJ-179]